MAAKVASVGILLLMLATSAYGQTTKKYSPIELLKNHALTTMHR